MADTQKQAPNLLEQRKPDSAPPCAMVIFGATGDLTKRLVDDEEPKPTQKKKKK